MKKKKKEEEKKEKDKEIVLWAQTWLKRMSDEE